MQLSCSYTAQPLSSVNQELESIGSCAPNSQLNRYLHEHHQGGHAHPSLAGPAPPPMARRGDSQRASASAARVVQSSARLQRDPLGSSDYSPGCEPGDGYGGRGELQRSDREALCSRSVGSWVAARSSGFILQQARGNVPLLWSSAIRGVGQPRVRTQGCNPCLLIRL